MGHPQGSVSQGATAVQQPPELITSLNLVKGSSDEERFAGLLMLVKYLNSSNGKENGLQAAGVTDVRRQVLEAVKLDFLIRLLRSPNPAVPQDPSLPPEAQNTDVSAYQAVAVTILSCLAQDVALVPVLRPAYPDVFALLAQLRDLSLLSDVFFLVYSAAKHDGPTMASALASSDVLHVGARTLHRLHLSTPLPPDLIHQACTALHEVVSLESSEHIWQGDGRALGVLVQVMAVDRSELKLGLVPIVALLLATRRHYAHGGGATGPLANLPVGFGSSLRVSLVQLLHGGLREAHRDSALAILVHGMALFGQGWAVEDNLPLPPSSAAEGGQGAQPAVGTAVAFFVHALAMEVRMASEELEAMGREDGLAHDDTTSDKHEAQVEKRRVRALALLPLCLDGLHSVLRFLCNAAHPTTANTSSGAAEVSLPGPRWEDLPSSALLRLRTALLEVVKCLGGLLRYVGRRDASTRPAMQDVVTEAARFLTVMLLEDEGCLPAADVIPLLPAVMGPLAAEHDPALLLPWVSRALSSDSEAAVGALVDVHAHLHLIDTLRTDDPHLVQPDAMLLLHEILTRGAALPCPDHDCLLANHPRVLDLLPFLATAAGRAMAASKTQRSMVRVQQYSAWFCLSLMDAFPSAMVQQALHPDSTPYRALLDALVQMLVMGGNPPEFGVTGGDDSMDEEEEEEERQEMLMLWTKTVALVRSADEALQSHVMQTAAGKLGPKAPERVKELLRDERSDGEGGAARTSF